MRIKLDHAYTAREIQEITQGRCESKDTSTIHLCTDTRQLQEGDLFVALQGDHTDGHLYLEEAAARGAAFLLCEEGRRIMDRIEGATIIYVKNTFHALVALAAAARTRINPTVIAITGSVGKTTTKNTVAAVLPG